MHDLTGATDRRRAGPRGGSAARRRRPGQRATSAAAPRTAQVWKRRSNIIEEMNGLVEELDQIDSLIAAQAPEHVHANEIILTFQATRACALFLREAAKKRSFQARCPPVPPSSI